MERVRWFHSKLFVSILGYQATEQPTRTGDNPTEFCGGSAQLDQKTGVPSRGQRMRLTQKALSCKYTARKASEQAVLAFQVEPSGKV